MLFWGIWVPANGAKKVHRGLQVSRMYVPISKLKDKPLTISLGPYKKKSGPKQPENKFFMLFGGIWAPPNGREKVQKGPQLGKMYLLVSKLENKPLTKSIGPFL